MILPNIPAQIMSVVLKSMGKEIMSIGLSGWGLGTSFLLSNYVLINELLKWCSLNLQEYLLVSHNCKEKQDKLT